MVGTSVFLACHQCYCAGSSLAWGLNLRALVCGIFWSSLPGGFLLPSPDSAFISHGHLFSHSSWKRCSLALVCSSIESVVSSSFPSSFFFSLNPHHWTRNQKWLTASFWSKMVPKTLADYCRHRDQEMNAPDWLIYTTRNERSLLIRSFSGCDCTFTLSRRRKLPRWLAKSTCISAFAREPARTKTR